jgi:hypothetical protein
MFTQGQKLPFVSFQNEVPEEQTFLDMRLKSDNASRQSTALVRLGAILELANGSDNGDFRNLLKIEAN